MKLLIGIFFMTSFMSVLTHAKSGSRAVNNRSQAASVSSEGVITKYYCEEFSTSSTKKNNWRDYLFKSISAEKYPRLFAGQVSNGAPADLLKYCPNYPNLSEYQRKIILMRLLDGMVFFESSCNPRSSAKGPNGRAYGLLQLHYGREEAYSRKCNRYDSANPHRSLSCALGMLEDQVNNARIIFSSGSYWDVLRPRGAARKALTIASHLWYYPLCQIPKNLSKNDD